jgi:hypothetical protein
VAGRSSGGFGPALGFPLLLGLVIQVVQLLVIPLTILAIGAVVIFPISLPIVGGTQRLRCQRRNRKPSPRTMGLSLRKRSCRAFRPTLRAEFTFQETQAVPVPAAPPNPTASSRPAAGHGKVIRAAGYRHGSCSVRHCTYEAAARCRNR